MKNIIKYTNWDKIKTKLLKDPEVYKEYKLLEPEYKAISKIIKLRLQKKITQKELAKRVDTKQSAISRFERNFTNPTLYFLSKVADALGKKLEITLK
jgi:DNA-binding XRE family transcriptional regulator